MLVLFYNHQQLQLPGFNEFCADGSKVGDKVASVVVLRKSCKTARLSNNASMFRAEKATSLFSINGNISVLSIFGGT